MFDMEMSAEIMGVDPPDDEFSALVLVWAKDEAWAEIRTVEPADSYLSSIIGVVVELRDALLSTNRFESSVFGVWGGCVVCLRPDDGIGLAMLRETAQNGADFTGWVDLVEPAAVFRFEAKPMVSLN